MAYPIITANQKSLLFLAALLFTFSLGAQNTISGTVFSGKDGTPLPWASVQIEGSFTGVESDDEGAFSISTEAPYPFELSISYLGYRTQNILVKEDQADLQVTLEVQTFFSNEIIVAAQLRDQILQDVPVSVSAVNREFIERSAELDDPGDLIPYIAGFSGMNFSSNGSTYTMRGINTNSFGLGADPKVAVFHDGAYNGRIQIAGRGFFDVERVEILKGPQSSLYGRNATAGTIGIYSNKPQFEKDLDLGLKGGNWGQLQLVYMLNLPLSNKLSLRFAGRRDTRNGTITVVNQDNHEMGKKDIYANRLSLLWKPENSFNATLKIEHQKTEGGGVPLRSTNTDFGAPAEMYAREINLDSRPFDDNEFLTTTLNTNWVINDHLALQTISAFNKNDQTFLGDFDGLPTSILKIGNPNNFTNFIQDIRLTNKSDKIDWLIAASYFTEDAAFDVDFISHDDFIIPLFFGFSDPSFFTFCEGNPDCREFNELNENDIDNRSLALYSDFNYKVNDQLFFTLGIRYTRDTKDFTTTLSPGNGAFHSLGGFNIQGPVGTTQGKESWSALQPRVILGYNIKEDIMAYASYNRGYLSGGLNNFTARTFDKETNDAYEVGLKSTLNDNKVKLNITAYNIDYNDLQVEVLNLGVTEIQNAAQVSTRGIELESSFQLSEEFDLIANVGLNDSKYEDYMVPNSFNPNEILDFSGNIPDRSPRTQLSFIGQYTKQLKGKELFVRGDYSYQSKQYFDRSNDEEIAQDGFGLVNLTAGLGGLLDNRLELSIYAYNLFDQNFSVLSTRSFEGGYTIIPGAPRLFGISMRFSNLLN